MGDDLKEPRIFGRQIVSAKRNSRAANRKEPLPPQIFWIAGIALLLFAEVMIFGKLVSVGADLRCAGGLGSEVAAPHLGMRWREPLRPLSPGPKSPFI